MILFSENITNRLRYVCDFIGTEILKNPITLTDDETVYRGSHELKINYSKTAIAAPEFHLPPHSLLFETGIRQMEIGCGEANGKKCFFQTKNSDFPFDVFAATFYLLSRYEEYLPHEKDEYGRFSHKQSLAQREGFLNLPLINLWLEDLKTSIRSKFPGSHFHRKTFRFTPTYDIDMAWKYKNKGWLRNIGGCLIALVKGKWATLNERLLVLSDKQQDPFDAYEWLDALHLYCRMKPYYFFLLAENSKSFDKNISPSNRQLQELIAYHANRDVVGIHPSWQSGEDTKLLKQEIGWLEFITGHSIRNSRQHYIRFNLPESFRELIKAGIENDFSMGYGSINGFRASVASSFYWFDLEKDVQTNLLLHPFCFMDANSFYEQKLSAREAFAELMQFYHAVKKVNGTLITIWHNNFLGSEKNFKSWREVYELFLKEEVYWDA